jgi:hypothetical protein
LSTEFAAGAERRGIAFRSDVVSADPHAVVQRERALRFLLLLPILPLRVCGRESWRK